MRTGPLVQRGAKVSRATQLSSAPTRLSPSSHRFFNRAAPSAPEPLTKTTFNASNLHLECRLPISLREFLADELGAIADASDANVLNLAASADAATLSKLARAIRRYSTSRAQQTWESCHAKLADFVFNDAERPMIALCLKCARIEIGENSLANHQAGGCISLSLREAGKWSKGRTARTTETQIADAIRRAIEEFRRLRAAFGLSHFDLDSYTHHGRITFTWRPLV